MDNFHLRYSLSELQSDLTEADLEILGFWCRESCRLRAGDVGRRSTSVRRKKNLKRGNDSFIFENIILLSYCRENEAILF